jgi:hypothetical protein
MRDGIWSLAIHSAYLGALPSDELSQQRIDGIPHISQGSEGVVLSYSLSEGKDSDVFPRCCLGAALQGRQWAS